MPGSAIAAVPARDDRASARENRASATRREPDRAPLPPHTQRVARAQGVASSPAATVVARRADARDLERLGDEIAALAAHLHAATFELLAMLAEFDRREGWGSGFRSCAHWLSWRTGIAPGAARVKVRVARALAALPRLGEAMGRGELSYAKVRAVTRVANAENEAELLELARNATAAQLERIVRAWRRVDRLEEQRAEQERHRRRQLTLYVDDDGSWVLRARLDPEVGAVLERALDAAAEALYGRAPARARGPDGLEPAEPLQRRADAIGRVAEAALAGGLAARGADRFQVVVHVDADALPAGSSAGQSALAPGIGVSAETSRRIACDARLVLMLHDADGTVVGTSRCTRTVPAVIRRALEQRDDGRCRFPGCDARFCDAHHVEHWADGGETRLGNLVLLCRRHHRAVHEEGFPVTLAANGEVRFYRPDGRPLPPVPAAPPVPADAARALTAERRVRRNGIDSWTAAPRDAHGRLDLDWAIRVLRQRAPVQVPSARPR